MKKLAFVFTLAILSCPAVGADTQQFTEAQTAAAFAKADSDKDGTITMAEAKKFGIYGKAFTAANRDNDGALDRREFAVALAYQFNQANSYKDGTLDWKEAQRAGVKSKKAFVAANPDKDDTLDPIEYLNALVLQAK